MSIRARRPRSTRRLPPYYRTSAWYARREAVRRRAQGRCEFCRVRSMQQVHHRTYAHFGKEPLRDLMSVCRGCHRFIHRKGARPSCAAGALMAQGDSGIGYTVPWTRYLAQHVRRAA